MAFLYYWQQLSVGKLGQGKFAAGELVSRQLRLLRAQRVRNNRSWFQNENC